VIAVHYDPADPKQSVLEVGDFDRDDSGLLVIGLLTLAVSILVFRVTRRSRTGRVTTALFC
jgi:ABC-type branched-subunit amino acid transport system permease subunit